MGQANPENVAQLLDDTASEAVKSSLRWELLNSSADALYKQVTPGTLPPDGWSLSVGLHTRRTLELTFGHFT